MRKTVNLVEKYLIRSVVLLLVVLVVVQGLMTHDSLRLYLSWGERMEGQNLELPVADNNRGVPAGSQKDNTANVEVKSPQAVFTLSIQQFSALPRADIIINGKKARSFTARDMQIQVMAGDVVEIDSGAYNFPVTYTIKNASSNLAYPEVGRTYTANQSMVMIGKVIVK